MTKRTFYKTTYVVEILHEAPMPEGMDLKAALEEAETGSYSGDVESEETVEVDGATMAKLLIDQRSDPGVFRLTVDGEDLDEAGLMATCAVCGGDLLELDPALSREHGSTVWSHVQDTDCDDPTPEEKT